MLEPPLSDDTGRTVDLPTDTILLSRIAQEQRATNKWLHVVFAEQQRQSYWLRNIHLFLIIILVIVGLSICGGIVSVTQQ